MHGHFQNPVVKEIASQSCFVAKTLSRKANWIPSSAITQKVNQANSYHLSRSNSKAIIWMDVLSFVVLAPTECVARIFASPQTQYLVLRELSLRSFQFCLLSCMIRARAHTMLWKQSKADKCTNVFSHLYFLIKNEKW